MTVTTTTGWVEVGVDYCITHEGIRNEDQDHCDFHRGIGCAECGGAGRVTEHGVTRLAGCGVCAGTGLEPCDLYPLHYRAGGS